MTTERTERTYEQKRVYLYLPIRNWDWVAMLLGMGRTVEILNPKREYRVRKLRSED